MASASAVWHLGGSVLASGFWASVAEMEKVLGDGVAAIFDQIAVEQDHWEDEVLDHWKGTRLHLHILLTTSCLK